jgi:RNA polymerase-binding transcription factor DksA
MLTTIYKEKLETQLKKLQEELEGIGTYDAKNDNWEAVPDSEENLTDADENTSADVVENWNERRATLETLEREYRDVKRALQKIELGTYGICEISGEPIEEARLQYKPDARTCVLHMHEESQLPL